MNVSPLLAMKRIALLIGMLACLLVGPAAAHEKEGMMPKPAPKKCEHEKEGGKAQFSTEVDHEKEGGKGRVRSDVDHEKEGG